MSMTVGQALARLRINLKELVAGQWSDPELRGYLLDGARDIARRSEAMEKRSNITAVVGTQSYLLPVDVIRVHRCEYQRTGDSAIYPLEYREVNDLDSIWGSRQASSQSTPEVYTMFDRPTTSIIFYPVPSAAGIFKVWYYRYPAEWLTDGTQDGTVIEIPNGQDDCLLHYAEYRARLGDRDSNIWQAHKQLYEDALADLIGTTRQHSDQSGGFVPNTGYGGPWGYGGFDPYSGW